MMLAFISVLPTAGSAAPETTATEPSSAEMLGLYPSDSLRVTGDVMLAGKGPFRFMVDTGSERTIVAEELARTLSLPEGPRLRVAAIDRTVEAASAVVSDLRFGRSAIATVVAPCFARRAIGADGALGVDVLQSSRVTFDFAAGTITLARSRSTHARPAPPGTIVVSARLRKNRLVISNAKIGGHRVAVLVDTGADATIANQALRALLVRQTDPDARKSIVLHSVTGRSIVKERDVVRSLRMAPLQIEDLPVVFYDSHVFAKLGLANRPAIMLGMDVLGSFDRLTVDFPRREILFADESLR